MLKLENPFRPGAGHMPPYLAGRETERQEFEQLLRQNPILENLILTGLRGVGKTVLLETFKPVAIRESWLWVGTDLSESTSVTETNLAIRLIADLSVVTAGVVTGTNVQKGPGFVPSETKIKNTLDFPALMRIWEGTPGLAADKIKAVLETTWGHLQPLGARGVIFAYDEAQNLSDHAQKEQYPLSLLLDVFQSIQRKGIPFMLVLTGLPTLFPKLVEARTFAERMFRVVSLSKLNQADSGDAIVKPIEERDCPVKFSLETVETIYAISHGYPYFIQFVCRETYDVWAQQIAQGGAVRPVPVGEIMRKLDTDFFAGRWARATDRQRDLLAVIAQLDNSGGEFTVQEIVEHSANQQQAKPFSSSHISQMLVALAESGLVYKNRWGKYSLAVPLLDQFILRLMMDES